MAATHAAFVTWLLFDWYVLEDRLDVRLGGYHGLFVQASAALASIINVISWFTGRWGLASICALATLPILFGFLYFVPLLAILLSIAAGLNWVRSFQGRAARGGEAST